MAGKELLGLYPPLAETELYRLERVVPIRRDNSTLERVAGVEPATQPWEGYIIPLNYTRKSPFNLDILAQIRPIFNLKAKKIAY